MTVATVALVIIAACQVGNLVISAAGTLARLAAARQMQKAMQQGRNVRAAIEDANRAKA